MNILAIETSCDDTGIAVLKVSGKKRPAFNILSNIISSQIEIHKKWGGVYPFLAKREHQKNLVLVLEKSLKKAKMLKSNKDSKIKDIKKILEREPELCKQLEKFLKKYQKPDIDLISVTNGPGLEPCLWVGVNFAKALSFYWDIPVVPVNHIEAHILVNLINKNIPFPAVSLIVSGGHTQLILVKDIGKYKILGETRDDAAGECFDKTAKILGLEYPGGPVISKLAKKGNEIKLPRPMINTKDYDFSFSGLKTAVLYDFKKRSPKMRKSKKYIQEMAFQTQQAIIDILIKKTIKASKDYETNIIILGGGVTANKELRRQFKAKIKKDLPNIKYLIPDAKYSTDNAVMIGVAGYFSQKRKTKNWQTIGAKANLRI